jgi:tRNA A37 threonylcarbamoyladenosine dehydratase
LPKRWPALRGYGSAVVVTSSFAMIAVSEVLKNLMQSVRNFETARILKN